MEKYVYKKTKFSKETEITVESIISLRPVSILIEGIKHSFCIIRGEHSQKIRFGSTSFDDTGKLCSKKNEYTEFLITLIEHLSSNVIIRYSSWPHFFFLFINAIVLGIAAIILLYFAYERIVVFGFDRVFVYNLILGLPSLLGASFAMASLRIPKYFDKEQAISFLRKSKLNN